MAGKAASISSRSSAWLERQLPSPASAVLIVDDLLLAGDREGNLVCWQQDGDECWRCELSSRIGMIVVGDGHVFVTAGREVVAVNLASGKIEWSVELDGSSDMVACNPESGIVVATSSVYDIEVNDFLESAIWRFNMDGELLRSDVIDERPWALEVRGDGRALLGIGRPRCGMLRADEDGLHWSALPSEAPITCGLTGRDRTIFGHADGVLTVIEDGIVLDDSPFNTQPGSVDALACIPNGLLVALRRDSGVAGSGFGGGTGIARVLLEDGHLQWEHELDEGVVVEHICEGLEFAGTPTSWISIWDGSVGSVIILDSVKGTPVGELHDDWQVNAMTSSDTESGRAAIGLEDGTVLLFEGEMLTRRLQMPAEDIDEDTENEQKSAMAARLRALRDR
jgi:hypothetical protein